MLRESLLCPICFDSSFLNFRSLILYWDVFNTNRDILQYLLSKKRFQISRFWNYCIASWLYNSELRILNMFIPRNTCRFFSMRMNFCLGLTECFPGLWKIDLTCRQKTLGKILLRMRWKSRSLSRTKQIFDTYPPTYFRNPQTKCRLNLMSTAE